MCTCFCVCVHAVGAYVVDKGFIAALRVFISILTSSVSLPCIELGMDGFLRNGVYAFLAGPTYETVAECRMLQAIGLEILLQLFLFLYDNSFYYFYYYYYYHYYYYHCSR